jgi:hypothetical protein
VLFIPANGDSSLPFAPRFEEVDDETLSFSLEPSSDTGGTMKARFDGRQFWCIFSLLGYGLREMSSPARDWWDSDTEEKK